MKLFSFENLDCHYSIRIFGIKFSFRHKCNFKYKSAVEYGLNTEPRDKKLIVSLTSFPARINTTHFAINTLLQQNLKPDKVVLWLSKEQFPNKENDLPTEITNLIQLGLEIKWCDDDIRSFKKLIPSLKEYPNDIIITADDDIYYEKDWLESLYAKHIESPTSIIAQRVRRFILKNNKFVVLSSKVFDKIDFSKPSFYNQMLGGSGCLYPPDSLHKDIFNTEQALKLLPTNDDIYFWAMAVLKQTKILVAKGLDGDLYQMNLKETSLGKINQTIEKDANKDPFKIMTEAYPEIFDILKEEN